MLQRHATANGGEGVGHKPFRPPGHTRVQGSGFRARAMLGLGFACTSKSLPGTVSACPFLHLCTAGLPQPGPHVPMGRTQQRTSAWCSSVQLRALPGSQAHRGQAQYMLRARDCAAGCRARATATQQQAQTMQQARVGVCGCA